MHSHSAMYVFSELQYIPCYAHGGVARLTGNLKQIYNQITMLCNKYTYIYRTTQGHTITTQPQYTEDTRHQTYQSHIPPSPYWSNLFCARSSVRPAVAARQSIRPAVACRTAELCYWRPPPLPRPPSAMARRALEAVGRLLEAWRGGELDDDAALAAIRSRVQRPRDRREPSPARQALRAFRMQILKVVNRINWLFLKIFVYENGPVRDVFLQ